MSNWVALRRLVGFNPPVPPSTRLHPQAEARLLPMDSIRNFDAPERGEIRPVESLLHGYSYIEPSDVAYAKVTPCFENGKGLVGSDLIEPSFGSSELTVLRPNSTLDQRYLSYVLRSEPFRAPAIASMTGAGGLKRVDEQEMRALKVWIPPVSEQRAIADHLDHETAEIDAFIADLKDLVSLQAEQTTAVLEKLVWSTDSSDIALRRVVKSVDQGHSPEADSSPSGPGGVGLLKAGCTNFGVFNPAANKSLAHMASLDRFKFVERGDLIVTRASGSLQHVGSAAVVPALDRKLAMSDKLYRIKTTPNYSSNYLAIVMMTEKFKNSLRPEISGAQGLARNVSLASLKSVRVPNVSLSVQIGTLDTIRHVQDNARDAETLAKQAIALAKERRASLISAAVTGQLDVIQRQRPVAEQLEEGVLQSA